MNKIDIVLDKSLLNDGIIHHHSVDFSITPQLMTVGASGSGKTFLNKLIIGKISKTFPDSSITVLDFKADDYHFARSTKNLYEAEFVKDGLDRFYSEFLDRQQGRDPSRTFKLLVVEELGSTLGFYDKKASEEIKTKLANLIFLGRSFNVHCLISTQRPDSTYFNSGVRDSLGIVIALGNLSKEAKQMLFSGFQDEMTEHQSQGSGYMLTNGTDLRSIKVPKVTDVKLLEQYICQSLNR